MDDFQLEPQATVSPAQAKRNDIKAQIGRLQLSLIELRDLMDGNGARSMDDGEPRGLLQRVARVESAGVVYRALLTAMAECYPSGESLRSAFDAALRTATTSAPVWARAHIAEQTKPIFAAIEAGERAAKAKAMRAAMRRQAEGRRGAHGED